MDALGILRAVFALAVVLGLILAMAYGLKRYAPQLMGKLQSPLGRKRLEVVETLVLDPARRLLLVRVDDEERLILLGEGSELAEPPVERKAKAMVAAQSLDKVALDKVAPDRVTTNNVSAEKAAAAPRPVPVQAARPAPVAARPKLVVPPRSELPRDELPKPRMYRASESPQALAQEESNDDLF